jgi:predicted HTH domain antitoxin
MHKGIVVHITVYDEISTKDIMSPEEFMDLLIDLVESRNLSLGGSATLVDLDTENLDPI